MQFDRTIISGTLAISLLLPGTAVFAQPPSAVSNYPNNTAAISISQIDPLAWIRAYQSAPAEAKEMIDELRQMLDKLQQETGMDLLNDGLLNLDQHASIAFRPVAGQVGEGLFQLNIKSEARMRRLLQQAESLLTPETDLKLVKDRFAGIEIYHLFSDKSDTTLSLAISKNTVLGSIGSDKGLKEMLYHQFVSPPDSRFRLSNTPDFKAAEREFGAYSDWVYLKPEGLTSTLGDLVGLSEAPQILADPWLQDALNYYKVLAFGISNQPAAIHLKSLTQHQGLSAYQQDYQQTLVDLQKLNLNDLLSRIPADAILVQTGAQGGLDYAAKVPSEHKPPEALRPLFEEISPAQWRKKLSAFTGLDFSKEIDPAFDSRYAWGLIKSETQIPDLVMVLGLHANQANFAQKMASELKLNYEALQGESAEEKKRYQNNVLKANMHNLKMTLETSAINGEGDYPASLESLQAEAEARDDWPEIEHPLGAAHKLMLPFSAFKADVSQVGTLYYQGLDETQRDGQTFFKDYLIYGYGLDGRLYVLSREGDLPSHLKALNPEASFFYLQENLPTQPPVNETRFKPELIETYHQVPIYSFPLPEGFQAEFKAITKSEIQPVFAQQGAQLLLASSPQALKKLLTTRAAKHPQIQQKMRSLSPGNHYFQLNMEPLSGLLNQMDDKDLKELNRLIAPIQSIEAASQDSLSQSSTQVDIQLEPEASFLQNLSGAPIIIGIMAAIAVPNFAGAEARAKQSSTKANMYTFQTILEIYAVDWEGVYPESVAALKNEAQNASDSYWRELSNPFTEESGEGKAYLDYSAYQAGPGQKGLVLYQVSEDRLSYHIYGTDEEGQKIQNDDGDFVLSNS